MKTMRSIEVGSMILAALALLAGCHKPKYGQEQQLTLQAPVRPVWAVAPAINLSGEPEVDPLLQADLLFEQLQAVNNVTVIPVNRVVAVYAALGITKVESEQQAEVVCDQLGCDALIIPTITAYDPYDPPKVGMAIQLLARPSSIHQPNVDARKLAREATPDDDQALPLHPGFIQVVGMYDSANGSVRDAVLKYAKGRNDPRGPMGSKEYFMSMDRYCGFAYHALIADLLRQTETQMLASAR